MSSSTTVAPSSAGKLNFVLVCIFIDMLGIGLIVPVMPLLVGQYVPGRDDQALWSACWPPPSACCNSSSCRRWAR